MSLLRNVLTSVWCIEPTYAQSILPMVSQLLEGKNVSFAENETKPIAGLVEVGNPSSYSEWDGEDESVISLESSTGYIAVIHFHGPLMKSDGECGKMGLQSQHALFNKLVQNPDVKAIIMDFDTPGGEASYLPVFAPAIAEAKSIKPILSYYNNLCCSAGYYLASSATEFYASNKVDTVGSIGAYQTLADYSGYFEDLGIKLKEIYAPQSTNKNKVFKDALESEAGETALKERFLRPLVAEFISHVSANRANIDQEVFTGEIYLSDEAISKGLIDGIKSFDEVIARAFELAAPKEVINSQTNNQTSMSNKKFTAVATLLGHPSIEAHEGHVTLSVADMDVIDAKLATIPDGAGASTEEGNPEITALTAKVTAQAQLITELTESVNALKGAPGAKASTAGKTVEEITTKEEVVDSWLDPNSPVNKAANAALGL